MRARLWNMARIKAWLIGTVFACVQLSTLAMPALGSDATEAQGIVDKSKATFNGFMADSYYSFVHDHIKDAEGLLIFPQVIKGGFFIGGSGGTGLLVVHDKKTDDWSQPVFYTIGSVSFGLQAGGEAAEVIVMIMSKNGVDSLMTSSLNLGGDVSIALGPVGAGAKETLPANFISFARTKGLFAGLSLVGSVVAVRDSLNSSFYGENVRPIEVIVEKKVSNPGSAELLSALKKALH